ncbi:PAS domain-containing protein [Vibrio sp. S4M6]|uniref:helix-turn-helix transcriptional regulator n=1 Tax=Vibrio sinus TaxID=2946865 RepID=UPI00202A842D|nr:PAS domain-containing protein [Vibrio sinus]MCL9782475.1 PAS domain-containing protein [Vibrio sinus]
MTTLEKQTNADKLINGYANVADGIALLFSDYVEVIIHDMVSQQVVYIANNLSKRKLGDPSALDEVDFDPSENVIGPYEKINWDGKRICSTSVVIRDERSKPIGMLCINMNTAPVEEAKALLETLLPVKTLIPQPEKLFHDDWQEKINSFVHSWLSNNRVTLSTLSRAEKKKLVEALFNEGAFKAKSSADYVANVLNMGRATVFNYLREIRNRGA